MQTYKKLNFFIVLAGFVNRPFYNYCQNSGYSFMLRSPNQTANQIRRSYKNNQSNIFVTVYFVT